MLDPSLDPKDIREKLVPDDNLALFNTVKGYVDTYYVTLKEIITNADKRGEIDYDEVQDQMKAIYKRLKKAGLIYSKEIEQYYDPVRQMFLADRFIKGTCPKCGAPDQYGDSCEVCASVYRPTDLINPYSALSGSKLELRKSKHFSSNCPIPTA
mgnify:CR=1 FL=1